MSKNDDKIKELLKVVEDKRAKLGERSRAALKTNGIFKHDLVSHTNINTIRSIPACIAVVSLILQEKHFTEEAAKLLEVEADEVTWNGFSFEDWIHDFKLRASLLTWESEKKKLEVLEKKLSDLRSEDAKTEAAIEDLVKELN